MGESTRKSAIPAMSFGTMAAAIFVMHGISQPTNRGLCGVQPCIDTPGISPGVGGGVS